MEMVTRLPTFEERLRARRRAPRERGDAALVRAIERHRAAVRRYLALGLTEKAEGERERMLEANRKRAEWRKTTDGWENG